MKKYDVTVVGAGIAGLSVANNLAQSNSKLKILLVEKEESLGGVLNLSERNYNTDIDIDNKNALAVIEDLKRQLSKSENVEILTESIAVSLKNTTLGVVSRVLGLIKVKSKAVIFTSGAIEKTQGVLNIPGFRPNGVYTAGNIQYDLYNGSKFEKYKNIVVYGLSPSSQAVIRNLKELGRKLTLIIQDRNLCVGNICQLPDVLYDTNKIVNIDGKDKIVSVDIAQYDEKKKIIPNSVNKISCDMLILGCGYLPFIPLLYDVNIKINSSTSGPVFDKNNYSTSKKGIYVAGDALYIHKSVDDICTECKKISHCVLEYLKKNEIINIFDFNSFFGNKN